jgi:uncharacterized membrane protein YphA (DoxX/SURF4 family)
MNSLLFARVAIAAVWIYQGLWCKLLGRAAHHREIVETSAFLNSCWARRALMALGALECVLAVWVLSGVWSREAAAVQTILLIAMNGTALVWARKLISDPAGMLLQNSVFLALAWVASPR